VIFTGLLVDARCAPIMMKIVDINFGIFLSRITDASSNDGTRGQDARAP
jgi:hypothetical protein